MAEALKGGYRVHDRFYDAADNDVTEAAWEAHKACRNADEKEDNDAN